MPKFPSLTPSEIIRILLKNDFELDRIKGSHHIYINRNTRARVVVPFHRTDLPKGTLHEIIKQSGLKDEELFV
jgi:predicted RNA binding protein YcfA (HicA-like mRNA interferase family)